MPGNHSEKKHREQRDLVYRHLCRRMVEEGYLNYARSLIKEGKQKPEGVEDGDLPKAYLVSCPDFVNSPFYTTTPKRIIGKPVWSELEKDFEQFSYQLDSMKTADGANIIDGRSISSPVIFNVWDEATELFNKINKAANGKSYEFDEIAISLLPGTFTYRDGGKEIKAGSKTLSSIAIAIFGKEHEEPVKTYLSKVTAFGSTGTGKVTRMYVDKKSGNYHYDEFYLSKADDVKGIARDLISKDYHLDDGIVAVRKSFETPLYHPSIKLREKRLVKPDDIFG